MSSRARLGLAVAALRVPQQAARSARTQAPQQQQACSCTGVCWRVQELKVAMRALGFEPKKEEIKKMIADIDKARLRAGGRAASAAAATRSSRVPQCLVTAGRVWLSCGAGV